MLQAVTFLLFAVIAAAVTGFIVSTLIANAPVIVRALRIKPLHGQLLPEAAKRPLRARARRKLVAQRALRAASLKGATSR